MLFVRFIFSVLVFTCCWVKTCHANEQIVDYKIIGNERVEKEAIAEALSLAKGQYLTDEELNQRLKKLYDIGFFTDVAFKIVNGILHIHVVERPTINQVIFEGNHGVTDKILSKEMKIKARAIYSKQLIQHEVQRLLAIYRAKGYFGAKIYPKIIKQDQNRVDVIFEIEEGDPAKIASINFVGNNDFSSWQLESVITTKESIWWKFFSTDDIYDPDKLEMDRDKLRKFYLNRGYVDFRILSATAELLPRYDAFIITFNLEEGKRYEFGKITIENELKHVPTEPLEKAIPIATGDWYSAELVEQTIELLVDKVGDIGCAFVDIIPIPEIDEKQGVVNLKFVVKEGPKIFINRINIGGNTRTVDSVIRREMALAEGDAINASKLRLSDRKLSNLGFFKKVDISEEPLKGHPNMKDINVTVKEQSTGDINFSVGYATTDGIMGMIRLAERNLFGRAYELSSTLEMAKRRKSFAIGFVNPYFTGRELALGVDLFYTKVNRADSSSYDERSVGAGTWIGYFLSSHLIQRWSYKISQDTIGTAGTDAFPLIQEEKGRFISSSITHELTYDVRNNRFMPTQGYVMSLSNEFAGVGGNNRYLKNMLSGAYYYPISEKITFGLDAQVGFLTEVGRRIRINDKFMLGGQSLRGFDYSGVGPHGYGVTAKNKNKWDDALGGDVILVASAQINFPLGLPEDLAISGHLFVDAGTLWDSKLNNRIARYNQKNPNNKIAASNSKKIRASVGAGISWASPIGVIGLDYGYVLSKAKGDITRPLLLQLGTGRF